ncbi:flippase activity-associated protein Agl23 [Methanoregula formicica]|uniref:TIGR03663 family protein n=1 Tax=Methanoregula formicica (strain DSM 22288 / NBRC 105244 / SMSP) TaxID=593750 RepID=L0HJL3_METFS|nr:flippase activity-associated protein Agl23 [Methanoregula formicica]AGB03508.1 TIGR03663 family protein [Methanoregula formicica SMSP]
MQQAALFSQRLKTLFTFERIFLLLLIIAFVLRFLLLDFKLLHHDEAIHSWFSYQLLTESTWAYDPSYHGPFLYFVTAGMFSAFGASDLVARLLPSLFGLLLIPLVYSIYRLGYISKNQTLLASLFIAISPDMVYFSRFLRHDIFMLFFTFLLVVALFYYFERKQSRFAIIAAIATAGALCCKEEMPILLIIIGSFFFITLWQGRFSLPAPWKKDLVICILLVIALCCTLYTGFGGHPDTIIGKDTVLSPAGFHFDMKTTGWYQAVEHWTDMHKQQRLGGPWFYYIPLNLLYELPIFILALIGTIQILISGTTLSVVYRRLKNVLRLRRFTLTVEDLAQVSSRQLKAAQATTPKSDTFFRFSVWWMILTMAFYAYVGEKVPWLIIPQLLPMCFVAVYKLNWQKTVIALVGCIFLCLMVWHVAFVPADINEPIVQVQNSEEMRDVMRIMEQSDTIVIASKDYWPLPWYFRDTWNDKITLYSTVPEESVLTEDNAQVIILHDAESLPSISGYEKETHKLSYWFSIYDNNKRLPEYYLLRDGKMGSINIDVFTLRNF